MGLFGKMFEKKACSVCGGEIGLLGNRKLEDGNLCKECASQLSPFFSERRHSTVAEISDQLAWREANKERVAQFNVTRTLGNDTKVLLDEDAQRFLVTTGGRWRDANPDVLDFSQVTGCDTEIRESRSELHWTDDDGEEHSYEPPRYDVDYDMYLTIHVNTPYFDEITEICRLMVPSLMYRSRAISLRDLPSHTQRSMAISVSESLAAPENMLERVRGNVE